MITELLKFYYDYEDYHKEKLNEEEATLYFEVLFKKDRIRTIEESDGQLVGYCESWRIGNEQLGRIVCNQPFNIRTEDINYGQIAYVNSVTIHPDWRRSWVLPQITKEFFEQNWMCDYFIGYNQRKYNKPLVVRTKKDILKEEING